MKRAVEFYSEGLKLAGDIYVPDGLPSGEHRAAVLLCHGYTGVKDLYLPDNAKTLNDAGYLVMTFDYKGWGESEGTRSRLAPYSRVADEFETFAVELYCPFHAISLLLFTLAGL